MVYDVTLYFKTNKKSKYLLVPVTPNIVGLVIV
jgi:hypothetical protein